LNNKFLLVILNFLKKKEVLISISFSVVQLDRLAVRDMVVVARHRLLDTNRGSRQKASAGDKDLDKWDTVDLQPRMSQLEKVPAAVVFPAVSTMWVSLNFAEFPSSNPLFRSFSRKRSQLFWFAI